MKLFDRVKGKTVGELVEIAKKVKQDPYGMVKDKSVGELADLVRFSKGGRISMFAGIPINPAFARGGADSVAFRRGGKIRKGSPAMKRKMARLRAMRK
jgi:hypothetical protein